MKIRSVLPEMRAELCKNTSLRVGPVTPVPGIVPAGPMLLRFGPGTFFGPDSVHAQHLLMICSVGRSVILPVASDKHPVLVSRDGW